ncbi:MAG: ABC transporter ATP-binding protein [Ferruginibacter sp.]
MPEILSIKNLSISFDHDGKNSPAVSGIDFKVEKGKLTAVVGESGSGKSVTALSLLQLLPDSAQITGEILFDPGEKKLDLLRLNKKQINTIRGNKISMIFQEPMTSLNPVLTCGEQVMEVLIRHKGCSKKEARQKTIALFRQTGLPKPEILINRYPHQVSGGQKQRVMIAMAMSCEPSLLIADEPTTALDVTVQKNILGLIKNLQQQNNMAVLLITHDLGLVADVADEILVMYKGQIAEQGSARSVLENPQHPYTRALLACRPASNSREMKLPVIGNFMGENITTPEKLAKLPVLDETVLAVQDLRVSFPEKKNILGRPLSFYKAVDGISFEVKKNETIGLVGESGCGKTTLGRAILQLIPSSSGKIILNGKDLSLTTPGEKRILRRELQVVFQDPYGSLNPRISIGDAITEPMNVHGLFETKKQRKEKAIELLEKVNLQAGHFNRYPHQFSGGQRQRICIARALALEPSFIIFDESVSALDVSVQAQVLNLISDLKASQHFTSIFISHDLSVVHYISDRIMVMQQGRIVEEGTAENIYLNPQQEYTRLLIEAIPGRKIS